MLTHWRKGAGPEYFSFDAGAGSLPFIAAGGGKGVGALAYHAVFFYKQQAPTDDQPLASPDLILFCVSNANPYSEKHWHHGARKQAATLVLGRETGPGACLCRDPEQNGGTIDGLKFRPGVCAP